jgi:Rrf2 family iron-sulfur cluster assembly transcriptional regulator
MSIVPTAGWDLPIGPGIIAGERFVRLTTKGRYAVTAMLDLALHAERGPISLADISQRQDISLSYLEQLFAKLRRRELVVSVRGPGGGYLLGRSSSDIYVAEIIDAVDESVDATGCGGRADCQGGETCLTHQLWCDLSDQIHRFLSSISLAALVARRDVQTISARQRRRQRVTTEQSIALASLE